MPEDIEGLDTLFQICFEADGHWPIGEHKYLALLAGDRQRSLGHVAVMDDEIVGFSQLVPSTGGMWALELADHPMKRSAGVFDRLVGQAIGDAKQMGGKSIRMWVYQPGMASHLHAVGFAQERELHQLRIDLPVIEAGPLTELDVAPFGIGRDEDEWLAVNNRAFADHPENGAWTLELLADRMTQEWFDPEGFLVGRDEGAMVGFCWTKVHTDGSGEIYIIAVDPTAVGRGFGNRLVRAGLEHLHRDRGCEIGLLYVDAANVSALRLYEGLGFWVDHIDRSFILTL